MFLLQVFECLEISPILCDNAFVIIGYGGVTMFSKYETRSYEITDPYNEIYIDAGEAGIKIETSAEEATQLTIRQNRKQPYAFSVEDGRLTIHVSKKKWYHLLKIGFKQPNITLLVPKTTYEAISLKSNVGNVYLTSLTCSGEIRIKINTGKVDLKNVSCKRFQSKGNTGAVTLSNSTAEESIFIKRNTGKVTLNNCHAREMIVKTNTGNVCGKLPPNTVFQVRTNTGRSKTPAPPIGEAVGGRCDIQTNTGSIQFE